MKIRFVVYAWMGFAALLVGCGGDEAVPVGEDVGAPAEVVAPPAGGDAATEGDIGGSQGYDPES